MERWEDIFKKISILEKEFIGREQAVRGDIRKETSIDLSRKELSLDEREWVLEEKEKRINEEIRKLAGEEKKYFEGIIQEKEEEIGKLKQEIEALRKNAIEELRARDAELGSLKEVHLEKTRISDRIINEKEKIIENTKTDFLEAEKNWRDVVDKSSRTFTELREGLTKEIREMDLRSREKITSVEKDWQEKVAAERAKYQDTVFKLERKSKRYVRILKNLYGSSKNFGYFFNEINARFFEVMMHDLDLSLSVSYHSITKIPMRSKLRDNFSVISKSVSEAKDLMKILGEFIQLKSREFALLSAGAVFKTLEEKYYDLAEKNKINLNFTLPAGLPEFKGEEKLIHEALSYIIDNSFEAITGEGLINIIAAFNPETDHISITVEDTGEGIPLEAKARVFFPFYTTKQSKRGLGLTKAKLISFLHNGNILVEIKGKGVAMAFTLPAVIDSTEGI